MLINELSNVPFLPRGKGVKLINIPKKSTEIISFANVLESDQIDAITNEYIMDRTRRGRKIDKKLLKKIHKLIYNDG